MNDDLKLAPNTIEGAIDWAVEAHRGQFDKSGVPYIVHPLRVMASFGTQIPELRMIAVLHDVIEDSDITAESMLSWGWHARIVAAVEALTHRKGEPYDDYIDRVLLDPWAVHVKIADIRDNLSPERMQLLDTGTFYRLRGKYLPALKRLKAAR